MTSSQPGLRLTRLAPPRADARSSLTPGFVSQANGDKSTMLTILLIVLILLLLFGGGGGYYYRGRRRRL